MLCPQCNGIETEAAGQCSACGESLSDGGRLSDYIGPYSPYGLDANFIVGEMLESACRHLFYCPNCGLSLEMVIEPWRER